MADDFPSPQPPAPSIGTIVQEGGPLTVAEFMDAALYHPEFGYYARAGQRSGRAGDFFTSVDVGPLFGELLEIQFEEMWRLLESRIPNPESRAGFDLVEAGSGNGRLSADILRAARDRHPDFYRATRLRLVEASATARAAHREVLGDVGDRLASSTLELPESFEGILFANELLDAMPVHQVVMRPDGLREVFVAGGSRGAGPFDRGAGPFRPGDQAGPERAGLQLTEGEPSTPRLAEYLEHAGVTLSTGARAEVGLAAVDWVRAAARRLRRGFMVLVDYGHEARDLYSPAHAGGTLTSFARHTMSGSDTAAPVWLTSPGEQDLTAHVDFTSVQAAAVAEGCVPLGLVDQTYFLMGILEHANGAEPTVLDPKHARALKMLILPGGLGSTMKVLVLAKSIGRPALMGLARGRLT